MRDCCVGTCNTEKEEVQVQEEVRLRTHEQQLTVAFPQGTTLPLEGHRETEI